MEDACLPVKATLEVNEFSDVDLVKCETCNRNFARGIISSHTASCGSKRFRFLPLALVDIVAENSPAWLAGVRVGDALLRFGSIEKGVERTYNELHALISEECRVCGLGEPIPVSFFSLERKGVLPVRTLTPTNDWGGEGTLGFHARGMSEGDWNCRGCKAFIEDRSTCSQCGFSREHSVGEILEDFYKAGRESATTKLNLLAKARAGKIVVESQPRKVKDVRVRRFKYGAYSAQLEGTPCYGEMVAGIDFREKMKVVLTRRREIMEWDERRRADPERVKGLGKAREEVEEILSAREKGKRYDRKRFNDKCSLSAMKKMMEVEKKLDGALKKLENREKGEKWKDHQSEGGEGKNVEGKETKEGVEEVLKLEKSSKENVAPPTYGRCDPTIPTSPFSPPQPFLYTTKSTKPGTYESWRSRRDKSHVMVDKNIKDRRQRRGTPKVKGRKRVTNQWKTLPILVVAILGYLGVVKGQNNCAVQEYYSVINSRLENYETTETPESIDQALHDIIKDHIVIPYTSTNVDCWDALSVLDADPSDPSSVILIYKQTSEPISTQGDSNGWNREHVWPKSYGVGYTGPDTSDLLSLRAADWSVNSARNNRFYDDCFDVEACDIPAHWEAAEDTGKRTEPGTNGLFMPPERVRGDLARSLFYMATRYDGSEKDTTDLRLSDCPCDTLNTMGVLSTLLDWHTLDPVDEEERERNRIMCEDYQHNRNPYIDYPDLVEFVYMPKAGVPEGGCGVCPEKEKDDGDGVDFFVSSNQILRRGDVAIVGVKSDSPKSFMLLSLTTLNLGTTLYVTDNGWVEGDWRGGEGTVRYTVGEGGVRSGETLVWEDGGEWGEWGDEGSFLLSTTGEQLYLYVILPTSPTPLFLHALQYRTSSFDDPGDVDGATKGSLPEELQTGPFSVAVSHKDNLIWTGSGGTGENLGKMEVLESLSQGGNWEGGNDVSDVGVFYAKEGYVDVREREGCVVGEGTCGEGEVCEGVGEEGGVRRKLFGGIITREPTMEPTPSPNGAPVIGVCVDLLEQ